jgi:hypothetical protein
MRTDDTLQNAIRIAIEAHMLEVHTALPANVLAYDPVTRSATVQPAITRPIEGQALRAVYEKIQTIPNVPVLLGAGLAPGDKVLLVFSEADSQKWESSGGIQNPTDQTRHGLGSPFCVPFMPTLVIGNPLVAVAVALQSQLEQLMTAINNAAAAESGASGLGGMGALSTALSGISWPNAALPGTGPAEFLKASPAVLP